MLNLPVGRVALLAEQVAVTSALVHGVVLLHRLATLAAGDVDAVARNIRLGLCWVAVYEWFSSSSYKPMSIDGLKMLRYVLDIVRAWLGAFIYVVPGCADRHSECSAKSSHTQIQRFDEKFYALIYRLLHFI